MKTLLLTLILTCTVALASDNLVQISGPVSQRYYPNPNLKIITHLVIESAGQPFLLLDYPRFSNTAVGDTVSCFAVRGPVYENTGQRIWYYVSNNEPTDQDKQEAAARIMQKYRQEVTF